MENNNIFFQENLEKNYEEINENNTERNNQDIIEKNIIKNDNGMNEKNIIKNDEELELGLYLIKEVFEKDIEESKTKYLKGSVRSGNKIMYDGSLVLIGDVNAGAEIIAGENIIVIGDLRGVAHAGANGNKKAIIVAEKIESPQLRIANLLWENQENNSEQIEIKKYAFVENEEIKLIIK